MRNKFYAIINTLSTTIKKGRKYIHSVDLLNGKITVTIKTLQVDAFKNRSKLRTIEQIFITKNTWLNTKLKQNFVQVPRNHLYF